MAALKSDARKKTSVVENFAQAGPNEHVTKASKSSSDFDVVWSEIARLGLERQVAELDAYGYTIVPPERVAPPEFVQRLRNSILDVAERRIGVRPNVETGGVDGNPEVPFGRILFYMLFEDRIFQEALLNPTVLALSSYLVGLNCLLSNSVAILKGPGGQDLALHTDSLMVPDPLSSYSHVCNTNWLLTDYSRSNGALCFVPGSHRYCRHPRPGEGVSDRIAVDAPAGSIAVWHGNTWHGAFGRTNKGLRISFNTPMMRSYMQTEEPYREDVTQELLDLHQPRFATLMGRHLDFPWRSEGTDYQTVYPRQSLWD
jgi:hypothetical protein